VHNKARGRRHAKWAIVVPLAISGCGLTRQGCTHDGKQSTPADLAGAKDCRADGPSYTVMSATVQPEHTRVAPCEIKETGCFGWGFPAHYPLIIGGGHVDIDQRFGGGLQVEVMELRGWLHGVSNPSCNITDPDVSFGLEVDPSWTDCREISLNRLFRPGSAMGPPDGDTMALGGTPFGLCLLKQDPHLIVPDGTRLCKTPSVHVEVMAIFADSGFRGGDRREGRIPSDAPGLCTAPWASYPEPCPAPPTVCWPYDPLRSWSEPAAGCVAHADSPRLADGDYVRIVGSLVTDKNTPQHGNASESSFWTDVWPVEQEGSLARWTEIHPPDVTVALPQRNRIETVKLIAAGARDFDTRFDAYVFPPGPRPEGGYRLTHRWEPDLDEWRTTDPDFIAFTYVNLAVSDDGEILAEQPDPSDGGEVEALQVSAVRVQAVVHQNGGDLQRIKGILRVSWAKCNPGEPCVDQSCVPDCDHGTSCGVDNGCGQQCACGKNQICLNYTCAKSEPTPDAGAPNPCAPEKPCRCWCNEVVFCLPAGDVCNRFCSNECNSPN
jgi:hypothetical protein